MNNKGFTLVELLSVIVILAGISVVVVTGIGSSLEKRDKKECEEQIALAKNAAKIYFSLNGGVDSVSVDTLINNGYFNETSKTNRLIGSSTITIGTNGYEYNGECKAS